MKRRELIQKLEALGCHLVRHGGRHDWFQNPTTGALQAVPRHTEVNEFLARSILRKMV